MELIDPRQLLAKTVDVLDKLNIAYMVTGGIAVFVWGRPRFTADIDIVVELEDKDVNSLASALLGISEFGYVDKDAIREAFANREGFNFIDGSSGIKVDFWVVNKNSPEIKSFKRRIAKNIVGRQVYFISPEDLILRKLVWFRESKSSRHIEDAQSILKISDKIIDKRYLKKTAMKLDVATELEDLFN